MSDLIDRDCQDPTLTVDRKGRALLAYRKPGGHRRRVLLEGAINARDSKWAQIRRQVRFSKNYNYRGGFSPDFDSYRGPMLPGMVAAVTAKDGSHWALQAWKRPQPLYGLPPQTDAQKAVEFHVSHWRGPLAVLEAHMTWAVQYGADNHRLLGRLTYRGQPVYGFNVSVFGAPVNDKYARNVYLDVLHPRCPGYHDMGEGWSRENGFLSHRKSGAFCYLFSARTHAKHTRGLKRGPALGECYRLTTMGPGVTPIIRLLIDGIPDYQEGNAIHLQRYEAGKKLLIAWGETKCDPL